MISKTLENGTRVSLYRLVRKMNDGTTKVRYNLRVLKNFICVYDLIVDSRIDADNLFRKLVRED